MRKDKSQFCGFLWGLVILLSSCAQLYADSYVDPANEFPICTASGNQQWPAIYGDIVVWQDTRNGNSDIYGRYLSTGQEFPICTAPSDQQKPAIYGDIVVWQDTRNGNSDIYGKDLSTDQEFPICTASGNQQWPAIYGDIVVWDDTRNGNIDIYGKNLSTDQEFPICTAVNSQQRPRIYSDIVVWEDTRNNGYYYDIYGKYLTIDQEFPICTSLNHQVDAHIYGNIVVYISYVSDWNIYGKYLSTNEEFPICTIPRAQQDIAFYGDIVVWADYRNGSGTWTNSDIYGKNIFTGQEFIFCNNPAFQYHPAIYGNLVAWEDTRNGNSDIYGNRILSESVLQAKQLGVDPTGAMASDPINTATGNFYLNETDLAIPGPGMNFEFARAYNAQDSYTGPFGPGWTQTYNIYVALDPCSSMVFVKWGDGQGHYYLPDSNDPNSYHPAIGAVYDKLMKNPDDTWTLTQKNQTHYEFDTSGKLISIIDKNGNSIFLAYDGNGYLNQITDTAGRITEVVCDESGLVQSITDQDGRQIVYGYTVDKLTSVTDANGNAEYYSYDVNNGMLKTITDRSGIITVDNIYDSNGRVIQQINGRGKVSTFAYNTPGQNQTTITDPVGRNTIHTYDLLFRLSSITDPFGFTDSYTYDNKSNRASITDKNGNVRYFTYDDMGNVLTMTAPRINPNDPNTAAVTVITYDPNTNNPLTKTDANGTILQRTWEYQYDPNGNLILAIDPDGNQSSMDYTTNGLLESETDENGNTTNYTYDDQGNLTDVEDSYGNITYYEYDEVGRVLTKEDARGNATTYNYDRNNNLLTSTDPDGKTISYTYDKNNNKTSTTDKRGHTWSYEYNQNNIITCEIDPCGFEMLYGYDDVDNRISVTDKPGKITRYTYDLLNRVTDINDPLGHHTSYTYDAKGNKISQANALGKTWTCNYDALDRLIEEKDPLDNTTHYEYDLLGRKTAVTDARGNTTQYGYDNLDRLIQVTDALGGITQYEYDSVGNLMTIIDANNKVSTREYDELNRLIAEADPLGNTTGYEYDEVGNRITKTDAMDQTTNYEYDLMNRLIEVDYPDGNSVTYSYDENGNRIVMTDWNGDTSFEYDALNRMTASTDVFGKRVEYQYDASGNRVLINYPTVDYRPCDECGTITIQGNVTYEYDDAGRLHTVTDWNGEVTYYFYDVINNLRMVSLPNWAYQLYSYDAASRLITVSNLDGDLTNVGKFQYTLDAVGNRVQIIETGTLKPAIDYSDTHYTCDDADRLIAGGSCSYGFNENGNQTSRDCSGSGTSYDYDPENRLTGVNNGLNVEHTYDGLGNRIAETVNGAEKRYVLDLAGSMSQVLYETDESGNLIAYYIYGRGLIAKITPDGYERYYHYDGLGSTVALTDELGYLTDQYNYTPFGEIANTQGSTDNSFKYVGQLGVMTEPDGTLFMRARFYDPASGRFLTKDPAEMKTTENRYLYANNCPTVWSDPLGLYSMAIYATNTEYNSSIIPESRLWSAWANESTDIQVPISVSDNGKNGNSIDQAAKKARELVGKGVQVDDLYIISHSGSGGQEIGADYIQANQSFTDIASVVKPTGTIHFLGCEVGQGETGRKYVQSLANFTGLKIEAYDQKVYFVPRLEKQGAWYWSPDLFGTTYYPQKQSNSVYINKDVDAMIPKPVNTYTYSQNETKTSHGK